MGKENQKVKIKEQVKQRFNPCSFSQRVDKPIDTLRDWEIRRESVQYKLVGVRGYGRDCIGQKQARSSKNYGF